MSSRLGSGGAASTSGRSRSGVAVEEKAGDRCDHPSTAGRSAARSWQSGSPATRCRGCSTLARRRSTDADRLAGRRQRRAVPRRRSRDHGPTHSHRGRHAGRPARRCCRVSESRMSEEHDAGATTAVCPGVVPAQWRVAVGFEPTEGRTLTRFRGLRTAVRSPSSTSSTAPASCDTPPAHRVGHRRMRLELRLSSDLR